MKKLFMTMLAAGVAVVLSGGFAMAHEDGDPSANPAENDANPGCDAGDAVCVDTSDADPDGAAPIGGVVAAGGDPEAQSGYLFVDGNGSNPDPLDGYIGGTFADGGLIGSTDGHAHRDGGNSPLDPSELPQP